VNKDERTNRAKREGREMGAGGEMIDRQILSTTPDASASVLLQDTSGCSAARL
jgi:hypothetical protein